MYTQYTLKYVFIICTCVLYTFSRRQACTRINGCTHRDGAILSFGAKHALGRRPLLIRT